VWASGVCTERTKQARIDISRLYEIAAKLQLAYPDTSPRKQAHRTRRNGDAEQGIMNRKR